MHVQCSMGVIYTVRKLLSPYQTGKIQDENARSVQYGSDLYCLETIISISDRDIQDENARPVQYVRDLHCLGTIISLSDRENPR